MTLLRSKRVGALVILLSLAIGLTSTTSGAGPAYARTQVYDQTGPTITFTYEPPFLPLKIEFDVTGNAFTVSVTAERRILTPLGRFSADVKYALATGSDELLLVIRDRKRPADQWDALYPLRGNKGNVVAVMDGRTIINISNEERRILVDVTDASITTLQIGALEDLQMSADLSQVAQNAAPYDPSQPLAFGQTVVGDGLEMSVARPQQADDNFKTKVALKLKNTSTVTQSFTIPHDVFELSLDDAASFTGETIRQWEFLQITVFECSFGTCNKALIEDFAPGRQLSFNVTFNVSWDDFQKLKSRSEVRNYTLRVSEFNKRLPSVSWQEIIK